MYVSYLAEQKLKHGSVKVYLSTVRNWQIASGHPDPFVGAAMPQLDQVMKEIKRVQAERGGDKREHLPISPSILLSLKRVWSASMSEHDTKMVWAACCVCFFAFLRVGEMTVPDDMGYDPSVYLSIKDISVDNSSNPSTICIKIKQSKTDPFRKGIDLFIGRTNSSLCPVSAVLNYLCTRGMEAGPLFCFSDGKVLTRQRFVTAVKAGLDKAGIDSSKYSGHSF